jgi:predicted DNA-binding protein YlxM (UPF0122 family)
MNTGDLLTVKEFAAAAGVSTQRIYKAMKTTLQPYIANTENGLTMLKSDGLREFGLQPCNPMLQTESCKAQNSNSTGIDGNLSPELATQGLQPRVASDTDRLIDAQAAEIETLKQQLETLQDQLTAKDTQISLLQAHTAAQQQTIDNLTQALTQQQALNAAAAVIQKRLIDQTEGVTAPEPSPTETGSSSTAAKEKENAADQSEGTPKRGILTHIQAALGGKSYKRKRNRRSRIRK